MANSIRELMTPAPIVLDEQATAADAAQLMKERSIGDVLVRGRDGKLRGIVTDRDLVVRCLAEKQGANAKLGDLVTSDLVTLEPDASVDDAVELMEQHAVRRIPIVENGKPVGIVSLGDLARARDPQSCLGQISAAPANA